LPGAYLERAHADNVRHVEMFFDPQGHTSRGIPFATVIEGLSRAIADAGRTLGIKASLIMCLLRHLDEANRGGAECSKSAYRPGRDVRKSVAR
jgi:adenine deaminase